VPWYRIRMDHTTVDFLLNNKMHLYRKEKKGW